jgi:hypothetical protein
MHTCCARRQTGAVPAHSPQNPLIHTDDRCQRYEAVSEEIRLDDDHLEHLLHVLLQQYLKLKAKLMSLGTQCLWDVWWSMVDQILPPLSRREMCFYPSKPPSTWFPGDIRSLEFWELREEQLDQEIHRVWEKRRRRELRMLAHLGYGGMEFDDVIYEHFKAFKRKLTLKIWTRFPAEFWNRRKRWRLRAVCRKMPRVRFARMGCKELLYR